MVLVTGATGLLGRVIVLELLKRGKKVRACKRPDSDLSDVQKSYQNYTENANFYFDMIEWVDLDFNSHQCLYKVLQDIDEVYHCAAKISFDPKDRDEVLETGIAHTRNLLRACMYLPVHKFLYVSSAATLRVDKNLLERQIKDPLSKKFYSAYVISKCICEKLVWNAYKNGLNTVIINPGMIIGSGNRTKNSQLLDFFLTSRIIFSGGTSCVDVRDVATIAVELIEKNIFGKRFCISSENLTYKELISLLRKVVGLQKPVLCPVTVLKVVKYFRNILTIFDRKAKFLTDENIRFITDFQYDSNKKIKNTLQHRFYSASEAIKFHYGNYRKSETS
ncbi:NAD-dependent epimerase/dehydratase family protein [Chryseobacterium wangxinyae]|uniref:NAD-dependent epimerase/dehydratase family protein n=1 Tax=Chryseobacterium sp. CY350 TaxID=2997336 RepID=UPI002271B6DF|nr:NAD-dependent epimerase/dehydratase family protein [Chryseobacterium sp. CY350]MCY0977669.1 NAD-dependent epimerase/dehydratase family protein [Chryseobacterium sp. CY350]WBZ95322.1 NAD-dependent epimerase/dehydratase family protein [Chryseobacterium sp. CY350]